MKKKFTDLEWLARDEARVAARRAKIEARRARADSEEVRDLERALSTLGKYYHRWTPSSHTSVDEWIEALRELLADARKAALQGET